MGIEIFLQGAQRVSRTSREPKDKMKTIFAQNNGYGDILWVEPIVRHFLAEGEEVFLNTTAPSLFDNYPSDLLYVNRLEKLFPLSDYPIELRFQDHPKMHHLEAYCLAAGISNMELSYPKLYLSPEEKKRKIEKEYAQPQKKPRLMQGRLHISHFDQ